jgi:hypothetical protein
MTCGDNAIGSEGAKHILARILVMRCSEQRVRFSTYLDNQLQVVQIVNVVPREGLVELRVEGIAFFRRLLGAVVLVKTYARLLQSETHVWVTSTLRRRRDATRPLDRGREAQKATVALGGATTTGMKTLRRDTMQGMKALRREATKACRRKGAR